MCEDLRERGLSVLGWSAEGRACAEIKDVPLVLLSLGDPLHAGRDGAWLKRVLVEHDDQSAVVIHMERFVMEPGSWVLRFLHHHDVYGPCGRQGEVSFSPPAGRREGGGGRRIPHEHGRP